MSDKLDKTASTETDKPKKKWLKRILLILLILLLVITLGIGFYIWRIGNTWDTQTQKFDDKSMSDVQGDLDRLKKAAEEGKIEKPVAAGEPVKATDASGNEVEIPAPGVHDVKDSEGTDILLLGSDQRFNGETDSSGARADTIMVMHVPKDGHGVYLISIMRDSWVNIPGFGAAKINAALNWGGIALQIQTVEQVLGVKMDHVAEIDFNGFKALTNAVGGVDVNVTRPFTTSTGVWTFTQGVNHMDGAQALAFVRERYVFGDGDYQRVRNQRSYLQGLVNTMKAKGALSNIVEFQKAVESLSPYMTVDSGLNAGEIVNIARPVISKGVTDMHMMTLPNAGPGWSYNGQSIIVVDDNAVNELSNALRSDSMQSYSPTSGYS